MNEAARASLLRGTIRRMSKKQAQPVQPRGRQASRPRAPADWFILFPALVVVVLCAPCIGLGYIWDDFVFLSSHEMGARLLPDPQATFYRPIPLGLYFGALHSLDPSNGALGHVLNLAALVGVIALLVLLVSSLCGRRAGMLAGLLFAGYAQVSSLVGWISASQDLFAIAFVIAALFLRHRRQDIAAVACATAALFCKETAIAAFPLLALWDYLVGRPAKNPRLQIVGYFLVAVLWATVHPGIHQLMGGRNTTIGYVGVQSSERWGIYLGRYLMTLVNLPPWGLTTTWPEDRGWYGFVAVVAMIVGLRYGARDQRGTAAESLSPARVGMVSVLLVVPSLVMPVVLVRYAAPHLTCVAAMGIAMFLGPVLAKQSRLVAGVVLAAFMLLGILSRGVRNEGDWIATESSMIEASEAARDIRMSFQRLLPTIPKGSQVVVSIGPIGRGVQMALVDGQALSLWYRDPTLRTLMIRDRRTGAPSDVFVRVTRGLDVIRIDPDHLEARSSLGAKPDLGELKRPVMNYARAVAAAGDIDRAIRIMENLNRDESGDPYVFTRRLTASMLLASGRRREADSVLVATAPFPREVALQFVASLQADASPSGQLDDAAFEAFGLSSGDSEAIRWVMRDLQRRGFLAQAAWFAQKLERLAPGDSEATEVLRKAAQMGIEPQREPGRLGHLAL